MKNMTIEEVIEELITSLEYGVGFAQLNYTIDKEVWRNQLKEALTKIAQQEREATIKDAIAVIENGGTGETILEIEHNGEKFVSERQLIRALKSLLPNDLIDKEE